MLDTVQRAAPEGNVQRKPAVRLRPAERGDIEPVRTILRDLHERTMFANHSFSDARYDRHVEAFFGGRSNQECIVAERNGRVVGMAWFSIGPYMLCDDLKLTTVHVIAIDRARAGPFIAAKAFARLVEGIRRWSVARGGDHVLIHVTTGSEIASTQRLMRAVGAELVGGSFVISDE